MIAFGTLSHYFLVSTVLKLVFSFCFECVVSVSLHHHVLQKDSTEKCKGVTASNCVSPLGQESIESHPQSL